MSLVARLGFAVILLSGAVCLAQEIPYRVVTVTDGGVIEGIVRLSAPAPAVPEIKTTKNQDYCGMTIVNPVYVTGANGELRNVEVFLKSIDHGKPKMSGDVILMNRHCMFDPRVQGACSGQQLKIGSDDPILHNTHPYFPGSNATFFNIALPNRGTWVTRPFPPVGGLIPVKCDAHEWMRAWIWEFDHPYFATTDEAGRYRIADVPPGAYTLVAWHEAAAKREASVTMSAASTVHVDFALPPAAR